MTSSKKALSDSGTPSPLGRSLDASSVKYVDLPQHGDERGLLVALELNSGVPFVIKRVYYIFNTRPNVTRGKHAHKVLKQLLICVNGSCVVDTETADGFTQQHTLDTPSRGLLIEGLVWREMRNFSPDAVLMVVADQPFDESDYIRNYEIFRKRATS